MEGLEAVQARQSIREFASDLVSREAIEELVQAACLAPSAGNRQPWFFCAVFAKEQRRLLAKAALGQGFVAQAPVCLVVCAEPERSAAVYGERGANLYCLQDTAAAVENLMVAAAAMGLGTCWVGAFDEAQVRSVLEIPPNLRPVAIVPVGYPAARGQRPPRRPLHEVLDYVH